MPGCGRRGKPEPGFPSPPTSPWKSLARFPYSRSPGSPAAWKSGNPGAGFHTFPRSVCIFQKSKTKGDSIPPVNLVLQAHLRIGKRLEAADVGSSPVIYASAADIRQIWHAREARPDRIVVVEVSREEFSDHFNREARAIVAMNHVRGHGNGVGGPPVAASAGTGRDVLEPDLTGQSLPSFRRV